MIERGLIDVHHHLMPPAYVKALRDAADRVDSAEAAIDKHWTPQVSLDDMDRNGVSTAFVSISTPGVGLGTSASDWTRLSRACNEYAANMVDAHSNRFRMFASLPMPDIEASLREIAYALDVLHADGIVFMSSFRNRWLGDAMFAPVFEELNRRKAAVYVHPTIPDCCRNLLHGVRSSVIEFGTDTTRTIASLLFSGAAARCPDIRFIFSHAGGTMPYLAERFLTYALKPEIAGRLPHGALHELQRFHYEVAQAAHPMAMSSLQAIVPISQILFGTDFPYRKGADILAGLTTCSFDEATRNAIFRGNALRLFPGLSGMPGSTP